MEDYDYSSIYDYEVHSSSNDDEFKSPYHEDEKKIKKRKVAGKSLLTIIQIAVCAIILIGFALLKFFGGDAYTQIKSWYLQNVNDSIVVQEQLNSIKQSFLHLLPSTANSQAESSKQEGNTSSNPADPNRTLVSQTGTSTYSAYSKVPVTMSVFLTSPVQNGTITSAFGFRSGTLHKGVDIAAPMNTKIFAAMPGKADVCTANSSYGNYVVIDHGNGIKTLYAHCSSIQVKKGDTVRYGQQIATVGSTGDSDGPHVHFELLINQINYDPQPMLKTRNI